MYKLKCEEITYIACYLEHTRNLLFSLGVSSLSLVWNQFLYKFKLLRKATIREGRDKVTMSHPSVPALFTLSVVYFPRLEALATAVQSTADSLWERTHVCTQRKSYVQNMLHLFNKIPPFLRFTQQRVLCAGPKEHIIPQERGTASPTLGRPWTSTQIIHIQE